MHFPIDRTTVKKAILQVALSSFVGLVVSPALASPAEGQPRGGPVRPCRLSVFVNDPDPAGLNLRSAAGTGSRVVAIATRCLM